MYHKLYFSSIRGLVSCYKPRCSNCPDKFLLVLPHRIENLWVVYLGVEGRVIACAHRCVHLFPCLCQCTFPPQCSSHPPPIFTNTCYWMFLPLSCMWRYIPIIILEFWFPLLQVKFIMSPNSYDWPQVTVIAQDDLGVLILLLLTYWDYRMDYHSQHRLYILYWFLEILCVFWVVFF